jgi:hypothetical protein
MAKIEKESEVFSAPRRRETVYVWSKNGRGECIEVYLKELDLSGSGCVLVVNRCRNGNKSSNFIKYGIFLTKKVKINFVRKRPLPEVGYVNVL